MNNEVGKNSPDDEDDEVKRVGEEDLVETVVLPESNSTDNVGDVSVEINVEQLIADFDHANDEDCEHKKEVRHRLEELAENQSMEDTYAIDFDKD